MSFTKQADQKSNQSLGFIKYIFILLAIILFQSPDYPWDIARRHPIFETHANFLYVFYGSIVLLNLFFLFTSCLSDKLKTAYKTLATISSVLVFIVNLYLYIGNYIIISEKYIGDNILVYISEDKTPSRSSYEPQNIVQIVDTKTSILIAKPNATQKIALIRPEALNRSNTLSFTDQIGATWEVSYTLSSVKMMEFTSDLDSINSHLLQEAMLKTEEEIRTNSINLVKDLFGISSPHEKSLDEVLDEFAKKNKPEKPTLESSYEKIFKKHGGETPIDTKSSHDINARALENIILKYQYKKDLEEWAEFHDYMMLKYDIELKNLTEEYQQKEKEHKDREALAKKALYNEGTLSYNKFRKPDLITSIRIKRITEPRK